MEKYIIIGLLVIILGVAIACLFKKNKITPDTSTEKEIKHLQDILFQLSQSISTNVNESIKLLDNRSIETQKKNEDKMSQLDLNLQKSIRQMSTDNAVALEKIQNLVNEKLDKTLEARLSKSFETVTASLKSVFEGLGEMKSLAKGVGDLKNVLTNVKTRGTFGEVQLQNLLEQILHSSQWCKSIKLNPSTNELVDFCIKIPLKDEKELLLPVDCKFPIEQYSRIVSASEIGDIQELDRATKDLENRIKQEAKSIATKYIVPNITTDFAVMYLPIEGLYAEAIKRNGLVEYLQKLKITIAGPTTFGAMLSSFQMGFRTLALEKRSEEIIKNMQKFRKDFETFVDILSKTQKKMDEAKDQIESATKRSLIISKTLSKFDDISAPSLDEIDVKIQE